MISMEVTEENDCNPDGVRVYTEHLENACFSRRGEGVY